MNYGYKRYWKIKILKFNDGDSGIAIRSDVTNPYKFRFRLENINCPELRSYYGQQAKLFAEKWVGGYNCTFATNGYKDYYGRYLGDIYLNRKSLISALRRHGYGR